MKYFITRPLGSQLAAWASQQSSAITSRKLLEMKWDEMKRKFADGRVPLPSFWGGYRVTPVEFEFWQGRAIRLQPLSQPLSRFPQFNNAVSGSASTLAQHDLRIQD